MSLRPPHSPACSFQHPKLEKILEMGWFYAGRLGPSWFPAWFWFYSSFHPAAGQRAGRGIPGEQRLRGEVAPAAVCRESGLDDRSGRLCR